MKLPTPPAPEVVDHDGRLADLASVWLGEEAVGLDTEFVRVRTFHARLGLIQVADRQGCYLVDMVAIRDPSPLRELIRAPHVTKVLHSPGEDLEVFHNALGSAPAPLFDTQAAATLCGLGASPGYVSMVARLFEVELGKGAQRSNWLRRPLTSAQVQYAGLDVAYLLPAWEQLQEGLSARGRAAWADEEFERQARSVQARLAPDWIYRRLRRSGMSPRQLAALRSLCDWRERRAKNRDLPRGFVVKDDTLVDLARRLPRRTEDLKDVRNLTPRQARRYGSVLLGLVRSAQELPRDELPASPPRRGGQPSSRELAEALRRLVSGVASRLDLPLEFLATRRTIETWAAESRQRGSREWPPALEGWRREVLEPEAEASGLLDG